MVYSNKKQIAQAKEWDLLSQAAGATCLPPARSPGTPKKTYPVLLLTIFHLWNTLNE